MLCEPPSRLTFLKDIKVKPTALLRAMILGSTATIGGRSYPAEVINEVGTSLGASLQTATASGSGAQRWALIP